jgi:hypothetical protein
MCVTEELGWVGGLHLWRIESLHCKLEVRSSHAYQHYFSAVVWLQEAERAEEQQRKQQQQDSGFYGSFKNFYQQQQRQQTRGYSSGRPGGSKPGRSGAGEDGPVIDVDYQTVDLD